jgi:hypothetical protein
VPGPTAARQIARAARWRGPPDIYVKALAALPKPIVEMLPEGIRMRGLDNYDAAWGERHQREWEAWKAARPDKYPPKNRRKSAGSPPDSHRTDPDPDADGEKDGDAGAEKEPHPDSHPHPADDDVEISANACWDAFRQLRDENRLSVELRRPAKFDRWHDDAIAEGYTPRELATAYAAYLLDDDFRLKGHPTALFLSDGIWRVRTRIKPPTKRRGYA